MKKLLLLCAVACGMTWGTICAADEPTPEPPLAVTEKNAETPVIVSSIRADRMTLRERRELGLTVANVRQIIEDLRAAGEIDGNTDTYRVTLLVSQRLMDQNPTAYSQLDVKFDWDKFLEFIEKIVELVMRIIGLFS